MNLAGTADKLVQVRRTALLGNLARADEPGQAYASLFGSRMFIGAVDHVFAEWLRCSRVSLYPVCDYVQRAVGGGGRDAWGWRWFTFLIPGAAAWTC